MVLFEYDWVMVAGVVTAEDTLVNEACAVVLVLALVLDDEVDDDLTSD